MSKREILSLKECADRFCKRLDMQLMSFTQINGLEEQFDVVQAGVM